MPEPSEYDKVDIKPPANITTALGIRFSILKMDQRASAVPSKANCQSRFPMPKNMAPDWVSENENNKMKLLVIALIQPVNR